MLPPCEYPYTPTTLPELWEAQASALVLSNTGMAVTTDQGNPKDVHPTHKRGVGQRLALLALNRIYGRKDLVCSGPVYKSMKVEGGCLRLVFDPVGSGLRSRDGRPLDWFEVAGADGVFRPAQAEIDGDAVVVWSPEVPAPKTARFGWNHVANPNLVNQEGLPAMPFRTSRG
jgi:sialate O-acetylesterase